jgi:hypothetical protein
MTNDPPMTHQGMTKPFSLLRHSVFSTSNFGESV